MAKSAASKIIYSHKKDNEDKRVVVHFEGQLSFLDELTAKDFFGEVFQEGNYGLGDYDAKVISLEATKVA